MRPIAPEIIDMAIARYRAGATFPEAAKGLMGESTLRKIMRQRGEPSHPRGGCHRRRGPDDPERSLAIYRRWKHGERCSQIGASIGIHKRTVLHHVWIAEAMILDRRLEVVSR